MNLSHVGYQFLEFIYKFYQNDNLCSGLSVDYFEKWFDYSGQIDLEDFEEKGFIHIDDAPPRDGEYQFLRLTEAGEGVVEFYRCVQDFKDRVEEI